MTAFFIQCLETVAGVILSFDIGAPGQLKCDDAELRISLVVFATFKTVGNDPPFLLYLALAIYKDGRRHVPIFGDTVIGTDEGV